MQECHCGMKKQEELIHIASARLAVQGRLNTTPIGLKNVLISILRLIDMDDMRWAISQKGEE